MRLDHLLSKERKSKEWTSTGYVLLLSCQGGNEILLVAMRTGVTPVPIPNTMVKTQAADGTTLETAWESRRAPDQKRKSRGCVAVDLSRQLRAYSSAG